MPIPLEAELDILAQAEFQAALIEHAERAARHAREFERAAHGPWMPPRGSHRNQTIVVEHDGPNVVIANHDHAAAIIEFGSRNNPAHAPLRRGALAAGLRLVEEPHP